VTEILMNNELEALAEILAEWIDSAPAIPTVYLFGSRVRGDHRPDYISTSGVTLPCCRSESIAATRFDNVMWRPRGGWELVGGL
jgi:hypothetical protein